MAKLQRKSAKVFAEQANAAVGGIAQFGSLAAGDIQYSKDVDVIQALDAYKQGWASAVVGNKSPAMEDRNALDYLLSYQQAYIMQHGVPEWLSTETYYQNSYVVDSNGELRVSVGDNNTGHDPILDEGGQYWGYAGARGSGKRVGEVYFSQSKLATDNPGALPLFTGDIINNVSNIYPEFYAWVSNHTELCVTQAQYESRITQYGECPFYVLDTVANTIRLPKLVNYIKMETSAVTQSGAGLPNITGTYKNGQDGGTSYPSYTSEATGAFRSLGTGTVMQRGENRNNYAYGLTLDASRSSSVYGASNTVTPAHTTVFPWVCAYQSAIPASTAQAAEFLETMSSKVDNSDLDEIYCVVQAGHAGNTWWRVYSDGWCEQGSMRYVDYVQNTSSSFAVNLHIPYKDTNYSLIAFSADRPNVHLSNISYPIDSKATTGFNLWTYTTGTTTNHVQVWWETKGYIDIES